MIMCGMNDLAILLIKGEECGKPHMPKNDMNMEDARSP
jgi:hypothetical protein